MQLGTGLTAAQVRGGVVQEMTAVWKKGRPKVSVAPAYRRNRREAATVGRHTLNRIGLLGAEHDGAIAVPIAPRPGTHGVADRANATTPRVNHLELVLGEKSDRATVRRPERVPRTFGPRKRDCGIASRGRTYTMDGLPRAGAPNALCELLLATNARRRPSGESAKAAIAKPSGAATENLVMAGTDAGRMIHAVSPSVVKRNATASAAKTRSRTCIVANGARRRTTVSCTTAADESDAVESPSRAKARSRVD